MCFQVVEEAEVVVTLEVVEGGVILEAAVEAVAADIPGVAVQVEEETVSFTSFRKGFCLK